MRTKLPDSELLTILKAGMEYTGKSVIIIDSKNGTIVANNQSAETVFGYDKGEMLGMHIKNLDAESYIGIRQSMHEQHESGKCWDGEIKNIKKDGTMLLTSVRSVSLGDYYLSFQEEITHRKYIEFFANIFFNDANTGFTILDEQLNLIKINKKALTFHPKETEESIEGKNILELDPSLKKRSNYQEYLKVLETGKAYEIDSLEVNGRWFKIRVFRINKIGLGVVSFDITDQIEAVKKAEAAKKESEELNAFKDGILRNVTHEFRTPLNGLNGFLEVLSQSSDSETSELVECMKYSADRLRDISDKFIDSQVIRNKELTLCVKSINVKNFMSDIFSLLGNIALSKKIDFILNIDPNVININTDQDFLSMIIMNLVSNAIKFSSCKNRVEVKIFKSEKYNIFQVVDAGIGIDPKDYKRIFESFYQVDFSACRRYEGIGLGLYNSLNYAKLLGGKIEVESIIDHGSVFTLKIPDLTLSTN